MILTMPTIPKATTTHALSTALLMLLLTAACADSIEQENLEANVTAIGPIALDAQDRILITYALRDYEGDDQNITLEICEANAQRCGTPNPAARNVGSLHSLPTIPARTDVTHSFTFDTACGRLVNNAATPFNLNTPYTVRITIQGTENTLESPPFTLGDNLGLTTIPDCP